MISNSVQSAVKHKDKDLVASEARYRRLFETTQDGILILDGSTGVITDANPYMLEMLGYTFEEFIGKEFCDLGVIKNKDTCRIAFQELVKNKNTRYEDLPIKTKDGLIIYVEFIGNLYLVDNMSVIHCNFHNTTERRHAEALLKKLSLVVEQTADSIFITDRNGVIEYVNPFFEKLTGYSKEEAIGQTPRMLKSDNQNSQIYKELWETILSGNVFQGEIINRKKNGELFYEDVTITPLMDVPGVINHFVKTSHNITERMVRERELEAVNKISVALRAAKTLDELILILLDETLELIHTAQGSIWMYDADKKKMKCAVSQGYDETDVQYRLYEKYGDQISDIITATKKPFLSRDIKNDTRLSNDFRQCIPCSVGGAVIPMFAGDSMLGVMNIFVKLPREITPVDIRILMSLSEVAANAIQRTSLHDKTNRDAQRFAAMHSIDVSINDSDDLNLTLNILLDQVVNQLAVSAAGILLFNQYTLTLDYSAGRGFRTRQIEKTHLNLGEGYAGKAALTRKRVHAPDIRIVDAAYARKELLKQEEFVAYYGVPLITKGKIIGVLDIFHRSLLEPDEEWLDFLEALASQAATAIDSAALFQDLQRSNLELLQAYDKTIEGWSKAMDLRDHETEGHTQRVTELAVRLARAVGLRDQEIIHLRRGALLHDMGKVGIPDGILLKPGPLTPEEWTIMRQHPRYAFDMLSPIKFLEKALDIPYCHHEKWDGTGYPRGLKQEQIPIAARIFALVDVWDALRSDRPYRNSWSKERVLIHIKSLSGTHFDPDVAALFLDIMRDPA